MMATDKDEKPRDDDYPDIVPEDPRGSGPRGRGPGRQLLAGPGRRDRERPQRLVGGAETRARCARSSVASRCVLPTFSRRSLMSTCAAMSSRIFSIRRSAASRTSDTNRSGVCTVSFS
jgi:hypothetical protein